MKKAIVRWASLFLYGTWTLFFVLPAILNFNLIQTWDVNPYLTLLASFLVLFLAVVFVRGPWFYLLTFPFVLFGLADLIANSEKSVDLLDLLEQWRTFSRGDVANALQPYAWPLAGAVAAVALWGYATCRLADSRIKKPARALLAGAAATALIAVAWLPGTLWARAWPLNTILITASALSGMPGIAAYSTPSTATNPRVAGTRWNAIRSPDAAADAETYVLVIGETLRSDYLSECGGPGKIRPFAQGAIVACDVTAGSDATFTSVPLLISREMPGHDVRIANDSTFQQAFSEVGFKTSWFGVQPLSVAWPDAQIQKFENGGDEVLIPLLESVLASGGRNAVVLHVNGAHAPYCMRFNHKTAPFGDSCEDAAKLPESSHIDSIRKMYANAVDSSVANVNDIIGVLKKTKGKVFMIFTPDHGENLMDDSRMLLNHALKRPTRWDIRIPAVFWANDEWISAHPAEWRLLSSNAARPLMHADVVPTLLGAAGIRFDDARLAQVVDLLHYPVPERERITQVTLGHTLTWQTLREESDAPAH